MNAQEQAALEEIYSLWLSANGKRERRTRRIIETLIGERRTDVIRREWIASRSVKQEETR